MAAVAENLILLFLKAPVAGKTKTRLSAGIGRQNAMRLYESFVYDILETLKQSGFRFRICCHPPDAAPGIAQWLNEPHFRFVPQQGEDLGERMKNAFMEAFADGYENVLLIGSDIPDLPVEFFRDAFQGLSDHDAVLGPSTDGGYYLIGFRKRGFTADVFTGIAWSSDQVGRITLEILKRHGASVHLLPAWQDIDDVSDLADFIKRHEAAKNDCTASRTLEILNRIRPKMGTDETSMMKCLRKIRRRNP